MTKGDKLSMKAAIEALQARLEAAGDEVADEVNRGKATTGGDGDEEMILS